MLNTKYFPCLPASKNSRQKFIIGGQFLHFRSGTNQAVQLHRLAMSMKAQISKQDIFYYLSSEKQGC